ncbi:ATPase [Sclerotinia borealis F-4128]|uniref:ATPase n=1 Tax=Sclerotinia borealis (strain F-4128) TaxID=1432307 RepID=W9C745_SCLBF|nr:ATPase [Sclerotinia borealis F-4128]
MPPDIRTPPFVHQNSLSSLSSIESSEDKSSCSSDIENSLSPVTSESTVAREKLSDPASATPDDPLVPNDGSENTANIKYSLVVSDESSSEPYTLTQNDVPFDFSRLYDKNDKQNDIVQGPPVIFEVIIEAEGFDKRAEQLRFENTIKAPDEHAIPPATTTELPPIKFEDLNVTSVTETRMEIHSQKLLGAIREVVDYYPMQNLSGDVVIIHEPYWILIHHEKELRGLLQKMSSPHEEHSSDNEEIAEHLKILIDFVQPQIHRLVPPIEKRLQNKVPTIAFDALGYLLRPGTLAYCQYEGEWVGCVIMWVKKKIAHWNIHVWFLSYDTEGFTRSYTDSSKSHKKHTIPRYEGEQDVTSLKVVPRVYWDAIDNGARREQFEARGARKVMLLNARFQLMNHKDETLEEQKRLYHGSIILDDLVNIQNFDASIESLWIWHEKELKDHIWMYKKGSESTQRISKLAEFLKLEGNDPKKLSKDQAWLIGPDVYCFLLDIKTWSITHIDRLSPIEESIPTKPVMEDAHLKIIKALAASRTGTKLAWGADSIRNKGKGVIILLHGPPGVGKTYSVEFTALSIKRPLLALTIADIGIKEANIEKELTSWFYLADRWKAVLLIDEADIFLERRKQTDLARNGIVSAFLRKMEYFSGLLFLTTNRVGHIDEAFMSRVHVVIEYPPLDDASRRAIWEGFFNKMRVDTGGSIRVVQSAKEYVMQDAKNLKIKLNGREIRNALQTAIALAEFEAKEDLDYSESENIQVTKDHFERVLDMSRSFRVYLDSIKVDTVELRAKNIYGRNDTEVSERL